jgi:hypothetical protein
VYPVVAVNTKVVYVNTEQVSLPGGQYILLEVSLVTETGVLLDVTVNHGMMIQEII